MGFSSGNTRQKSSLENKKKQKRLDHSFSHTQNLPIFTFIWHTCHRIQNSNQFFSWLNLSFLHRYWIGKFVLLKISKHLTILQSIQFNFHFLFQKNLFTSFKIPNSWDCPYWLWVWLVCIFYPPQLRTQFNWLLINLSATDLCVALLGNPVLAYNAFHRTWKLSETACQLNAFGMTFLGMERGFYIFTYVDQYYIKYLHYTHLRTLRVNLKV